MSVFRLLLCLSIFSFSEIKAQDTIVKKDLLDFVKKMRTSKVDSTKIAPQKRVSFYVVPMLGSVEGQNVIITPLVSNFYLGSIKNTRISYVYFYPYFTLSGQYVVPLKAFIYTNKNKYNVILDYKYEIYPQKTYALGADGGDSKQSIVHYNLFKFNQIISKGITKNNFLGIGYEYGYYYKIKEENLISGPSDYLKYMGDQAYQPVALKGFFFQYMYDSRDNTLNARRGFFLRSYLNYKPTWLGNSNTSGVLSLDTRKYFSFSNTSHKVLAFNLIFTDVSFGHTDYFDLPSNGWAVLGGTARGIARGNYRSNAMVYLESEYRTDITKNGLFGMVFFCSVTAPSAWDTYTFKRWYPSVGSGLRLKLDKKTRSNLTFDVGVSEHYWTWYVGINEAF